MKINFIYAFRNIRNNLTNSIITVIGLAVAIACCLIIYFYVSQEYGFNSFHENIDKIYRINYTIRYIDATNKDVRIEPEIVERIKKEIPQIDKSAEFRFAYRQVLSCKQNYFDIDASYASEDFFEIFRFKFLAGNRSNVLKNPYEIVITRQLANKLKGSGKNYSDLLGEHIEFPLSYDTPFKIVGIIDSIPYNSSIRFDAVVSGKSGNNFGGCSNSFGYTTVYYQIKEKVNPKDVEKNVNKLISTYYTSLVKRLQGENQLVKSDNAFVPFILPFKDVYLAGDINTCCESSADKKNFVILITITLLILFIACCNYTILSLGQYLKKIGSVGIRKAIGANSINIFGVFLSEGFILTFVAFLAGGIICSLCLPVFGKLAQTQIIPQLLDIPKVILFIIVLFLGISIITSLLPVLIFSKVSPHQMAGNKIKVGNKSKLSQLFVSFQYSLSIILIIVTLFIVRQSNYLKNRSLGLDSDNIIDVSIDRIDEDKKASFRDMISECPGVINLTLSDRNFMNGNWDEYVDRGDGERIDVYQFKIDQNYIPTLNIKLIQGRNFTRSNINPNDRSIIVNKKFIEVFGISNNPIGKTYNVAGRNFSIIGVVENYHFNDLKEKLLPVMLHARTRYANSDNNLLIKYHPAQLSTVVAAIKKSYDKVAPGKTLTYEFWNETLRQRYETEERWSKIIGIASAIAIIISSLGLFGLTVLLINQRVKEIGLRKVNGANAVEVLFTINKSFLIWLIGSLIIAIPVSYYAVVKWLESFPYKIDVSWWVFIVAGIMAFSVAMLTVMVQSYNAATKNPVEALRYE